MIWFPARDRKLRGGGGGAKTELHHGTMGGSEEDTRRPGALAEQPDDEWGLVAPLGEGSRAGLVGSPVDKTLGLEKSGPVLWGRAGCPPSPISPSPPGLSPDTTYRKEGTQARFSIRWILFCRKQTSWGNWVDPVRCCSWPAGALGMTPCPLNWFSLPGDDLLSLGGWSRGVNLGAGYASLKYTLLSPQP